MSLMVCFSSRDLAGITETDGSSGSISNLDSLIFAITTLGCCHKKVCQLGEMNFLKSVLHRDIH